jgi:dTDP-4-dehydrorhamnose reductase
MKYNRVYIAGSGGMLGSYVRDAFKRQRVLVKCTDIDLNESWIEYGDIRDYRQMESQIKSYQPDLIINLAALTDLEMCEVDYTNCFATNTIGAINLMEISKELNVPYIFISTAGVFGGEKDFFVDADKPTPLSIYAKSKVFAENYLLTNYDKTWIFRAGWMMGGGKRKDKKFVAKILKQVDAGATELNVVDDKLGTPTYTEDFANSLYRHSVEELPYGLYNMVSKGDASRYDVACEIVRVLNLDIKVNRVNSDHFSAEYFAPRPYSEKLINESLNRLNKNYMRDWKTCLHNYLNEYNK